MSHNLEQYLVKLGLEAEAASLYIAMVRLHNPPVLQLAKQLGVSRTQVYRKLHTLQQFNLVHAEKLSHGTQYWTLPLENIESIIQDRQAELDRAQRDLGAMSQLVREFAGKQSDVRNVRHYYGLAGLKQANWNLTKAKKEYRVFETGSLMQHFAHDPDFVRRCNEKLTANNLVSYDLTNALPSLEDMAPYNLDDINYRYIDPKVLRIDFEMYLYNDVVALLDYDPANMNAVEITHPALSGMMRQIYDIIWAMAKPIDL